MRFYGFGNYYLSSLQQGLQAGHTVAELFISYSAPQEEMLFDWANDHKTMVLLNGGNSRDLQELYDFFNCEENPFPFAKFHEDEQSLNGALTYVGIILPPEIYETAAALRNKEMYVTSVASKPTIISTLDPSGNVSKVPDLSEFEIALCVKLNQYGLAK